MQGEAQLQAAEAAVSDARSALQRAAMQQWCRMRHRAGQDEEQQGLQQAVVSWRQSQVFEELRATRACSAEAAVAMQAHEEQVALSAAAEKEQVAHGSAVIDRMDGADALGQLVRWGLS